MVRATQPLQSLSSPREALVASLESTINRGLTRPTIDADVRSITCDRCGNIITFLHFRSTQLPEAADICWPCYKALEKYGAIEINGAKQTRASLKLFFMGRPPRLRATKNENVETDDEEVDPPPSLFPEKIKRGEKAPVRQPKSQRRVALKGPQPTQCSVVAKSERAQADAASNQGAEAPTAVAVTPPQALAATIKTANNNNKKKSDAAGEAVAKVEEPTTAAPTAVTQRKGKAPVEPVRGAPAPAPSARAIKKKATKDDAPPSSTLETGDVTSSAAPAAPTTPAAAPRPTVSCNDRAAKGRDDDNKKKKTHDDATAGVPPTATAEAVPLPPAHSTARAPDGPATRKAAKRPAREEEAADTDAKAEHAATKPPPVKKQRNETPTATPALPAPGSEGKRKQQDKAEANAAVVQVAAAVPVVPHAPSAAGHQARLVPAEPLIRDYCRRLACATFSNPRKDLSTSPNALFACNGIALPCSTGATVGVGIVAANNSTSRVISVRTVPSAAPGLWFSVLCVDSDNRMCMWYCPPGPTAESPLGAPVLIYTIVIGAEPLHDVDWLPVPLDYAPNEPRVLAAGSSASPLALCTLVRNNILVHAVVPTETKDAHCTCSVSGLTVVKRTTELDPRAVRWGTDGTVAGTFLVLLTTCGSTIVYAICKGYDSTVRMELEVKHRLRPSVPTIVIPSGLAHPPFAVGVGANGKVVLVVGAGKSFSRFAAPDFRNTLNMEMDDDITALGVDANGGVLVALNDGVAVSVSEWGVSALLGQPLVSRGVAAVSLSTGPTPTHFVGTQHGHFVTLPPSGAPSCRLRLRESTEAGIYQVQQSSCSAVKADEPMDARTARGLRYAWSPTTGVLRHVVCADVTGFVLIASVAN